MELYFPHNIRRQKEEGINRSSKSNTDHENVKHWHGATKDSWFSHIVITAGDAEWFEEVSDEEYEKLKIEFSTDL